MASRKIKSLDSKPEEITLSNRVLKVLNAPITIWFLSAIFLSVGGTYYATFQQCHRDFNLFREQYDKIANEYLTRRRIIAGRLIEAKSVEAVKAAVSNNDGLYAEYRGRPYYEIEDLFNRLSAQVDSVVILSENANNRIAGFKNSKGYERFSLFTEGELPDFNTKDLPEIRNFGTDFAIYLEDEADLYVRSKLEAKCGPVDIFKIATGEQVFRGRSVGIGGFIDFATEYVKNKAKQNAAPLNKE